MQMKLSARRWTLCLLMVATAYAPSAMAGGFFIPGVGARGMARGGAFQVLADDLTALAFNPAGLSIAIKASSSNRIERVVGIKCSPQRDMGGFDVRAKPWVGRRSAKHHISFHHHPPKATSDGQHSCARLEENSTRPSHPNVMRT